MGAALFFYAMPLPDYVKWPLIIFSVGVGAALAFLPFDGRPLDRMIIVFFKAVYSPTQYIWRKNPTVPDYFNFTRKAEAQVDPAEQERLRLRKNLGEYLRSLPGQTDPAALNPTELEFVKTVTNMYDQVAPSAQVQPGIEVPIHPQMKVTSHKLKPLEEISEHVAEEAHLNEPPSVPQIEPVAVVTTPEPVATPVPVDPQSQVSQPYMESALHLTADTSQTQQAKTNTHLPIPKPPTTPNTLVGMVIDSLGKIVENAVIEVRDSHNIPVRALKTNSLGQFFSASPLSNGVYQLVTEKPDLNFDIVSVELKGEIVAPLEINAAV